jgi:chemotaxis-related protein WspB
VSVLTFQVGSERCGVDVRRVAEVLPRVRLQPASGAPACVAGLFVHRGRPVPVVDLHRVFGAGECPPHLSSRIILVPVGGEGSGRYLGLLAARVADIVTLSDDDATTGGFVTEGGRLLRLVDPDQLIASAGGAEALLRLTA